MKTNAFNKFQENQAKDNYTYWGSVISGNHPITVDPSDFCVNVNTFRKQARAEGFKTKIWNCDEVVIYRGNCI